MSCSGGSSFSLPGAVCSSSEELRSMCRAVYVWVTISSSMVWNETFLAGGKKTLLPVRGLALAERELPR